MRCFSVILLLAIVAMPCLAQQTDEAYKNAITVKAFGLSVHLKESPHPEIFPNRLDDKGYITFNYGAIVGYDRFIVRNVHAIRLEQGLYADCAASLAGFTHIGWRGRIFQKNRHSLNGGIGPTLVYRRDWNRIVGYKDDGYFNKGGGWQYKFYWYAGELEYNYKLQGKTDLSVSLVPGLPELVSVGIGVRQRF
ncbi:hypothetical protein [Pontibacter fetidus]|uniref:DUF3575 domain-containing protein n=1 Tax=Pontibacter fetidus TaxID=2700082 RepID=A0A6B2H1L8_9BACT|nr:hypothetical protein [Pontibacter fetidus]NDK57169.1 hypothetical protein [Pontibacter fetidus]